MEAIELLRSRYSASKLGAPAPSAEAVEAMLEAGEILAQIPIVEQIVSAGCAAHALMLAARAQRFGAFWRTGEAADDEIVKDALGVGSDDQIVGFIHVGIDNGGAPSRSRPVVQELAQRWAGDGHQSAIP